MAKMADRQNWEAVRPRSGTESMTHTSPSATPKGGSLYVEQLAQHSVNQFPYLPYLRCHNSHCCTASFTLFILQVMVDVDDKNEWKECIDIAGVRLPTGYYFGASAATGDLSGMLEELRSHNMCQNILHVLSVSALASFHSPKSILDSKLPVRVRVDGVCAL